MNDTVDYTSNGKGEFEHYSCRNACLTEIFSEPGIFLDLAGGESIVSQHFSNLGFKAVLIDMSLKALRIAKYQRGVHNCCQLRVEKQLPFQDKTFDYIFMGDVIEHIWYPKEVLLECHRILKGQGKIAISFPNMGYWLYRLLYLKNGNICSTEVYRHYHWEFEHIRFFHKDSIEKLLHITNFKVETVYPIIKPHHRFENLNKMFSKIKPDLFGEDFLVVAKK
ncbi:MAG TPA: class I SAM-dependent methyltransferase [Candidatus Scalindua sp.]|nr:class I SAM-dependent methyltransferase [Candidatus Scalindua sp.]